MRDNDLITSQEVGNYRINIYPDTNSRCPATDWSMGALYLFEYSDSHSLHDGCNWADRFSTNDLTLIEALRDIAADVVEQNAILKYYKAGKVKNMRFAYNRSARQWELQHTCGYSFEVEPHDLKAHDYRPELVECLGKDELIALIQECAKDFVIKEWGSIGYSQGDYLQGIAYISKSRFEKYFGRCKDWKTQAITMIDAEVKSIGKWAWGDVKGYVLEKKVPFAKVYDDEDRDDEDGEEWEEIDSCWGYYMESEELIGEVISEHGLTEAA